MSKYPALDQITDQVLAEILCPPIARSPIVRSLIARSLAFVSLL